MIKYISSKKGKKIKWFEIQKLTFGQYNVFSMFNGEVACPTTQASRKSLSPPLCSACRIWKNQQGYMRGLIIPTTIYDLKNVDILDNYHLQTSRRYTLTQKILLPILTWLQVTNVWNGHVLLSRLEKKMKTT